MPIVPAPSQTMYKVQILPTTYLKDDKRAICTFKLLEPAEFASEVCWARVSGPRWVVDGKFVHPPGTVLNVFAKFKRPTTYGWQFNWLRVLRHATCAVAKPAHVSYGAELGEELDAWFEDTSAPTVVRKALRHLLGVDD